MQDTISPCMREGGRDASHLSAWRMDADVVSQSVGQGAAYAHGGLHVDL